MKFVVDSHTHSISSGHAYSTVQEMAREAGENGMEMFALTDHGPSMLGASGPYHFWNLRILPREIYGVRVLKGVEANIVDYAGKLDLQERYLANLEFVLASLHDVTIEPAGVEEHTQALIGALQNPYVDAVAHPGNPVFQVDIDRVVRAAAEYGKLIEINNHSAVVRKGSTENCVEFIRKCRQYGVRVTCGSDAHISFDVGKLDRVKNLLEEAEMPEELILSTSVEKFEEYLAKRKEFKKKYGQQD